MRRILVMMFTIIALALASNTAMASDNEFILGGGAAANNICKYAFGFAEEVYWFDGEHSLGIGAYGMLESGESKIISYKWDGQLAGPQVGYKLTTIDDQNVLRQVQLKLRYVWEETSGENSQSGYKMIQDTTKLGLYGEYVVQFDPRWRGSLVAEGWKTLSKERESTWADDEPENRDQAMGGGFIQYKFSNPLSVKGGASLFYQGWDEMTGVRVQGEVRLYERVMLGAYVSTPFGVPDEYKEFNAEIADLTTVGIYGRVEF